MPLMTSTVTEVDPPVAARTAQPGMRMQDDRRRRRVDPGGQGEVVGHGPGTYPGAMASPEDGEKLPIKMLNDRILVRLTAEGERRTSGGILIPATAEMKKRLVWAEVVAAGPNVRTMEPGDHVLFSPEDRYEVEVRGDDYIILRERDIHAVAAKRLEDASTGLYL